MLSFFPDDLDHVQEAVLLKEQGLWVEVIWVGLLVQFFHLEQEATLPGGISGSSLY